jgi:hypothetical protein
MVSKMKNKGGRPKIIFTPDQVHQVEALAAYLSVEQIADYFGIAPNTFTEVRERQPEVLAAYKKGRANAIAVIAQKGIIQQAQEGNVAAACFYLKTQAGWREKDSSDLEKKPSPPADPRFAGDT